MHVIPEKKISAKASEVTGVTMVGQSMIVNGKAVEAVSIKSALDRFIKYLEKCRKDSPVILVGHNIESYDCKVLLHALQNCGKCSDFQRNVTGFLDTYKLFKKCFPNMKSYKQEELVKALIGESYMAHCALHDVVALQKLMKSANLEQTDMNKSAFSLERAIKAYDISQHVASNIPSLQTMIDKKIISKGIARSIAGSGLQFQHLCVVSKRNGVEGLKSLLSEVSNGQIRVTKSEKIIMGIANYISQYH